MDFWVVVTMLVVSMLERTCGQVRCPVTVNSCFCQLTFNYDTDIYCEYLGHVDRLPGFLSKLHSTLLDVDRSVRNDG